MRWSNTSVALQRKQQWAHRLEPLCSELCYVHWRVNNIDHYSTDGGRRRGERCWMVWIHPCTGTLTSPSAGHCALNASAMTPTCRPHTQSYTQTKHCMPLHAKSHISLSPQHMSLWTCDILAIPSSTHCYVCTLEVCVTSSFTYANFACWFLFEAAVIIQSKLEEYCWDSSFPPSARMRPFVLCSLRILLWGGREGEFSRLRWSSWFYLSDGAVLGLVLLWFSLLSLREAKLISVLMSRGTPSHLNTGIFSWDYRIHQMFTTLNVTEMKMKCCFEMYR